MIDPRYNRTFVDKFHEWTGQPVFWAAIASLGLHGILFAALPSFSSDSVTSNDRTVSLVELGAEELQRLPNFPELETPSLPTVEDLYDIEPGQDPLEDLLNDLDTGNQDTEGSTSPFFSGSRSFEPPRQRISVRPFSGLGSLYDRPNTQTLGSNQEASDTVSPKAPPPPEEQELKPQDPEDIVDEASSDDTSPDSGEQNVGEENIGAVNNGNEATTESKDSEEPKLTPEEIDKAINERLLAAMQHRQNEIVQQRQGMQAYLSGFEQIKDLYAKWSQGEAVGPIFIDDTAMFPKEACAAGQDEKVVLGVFVGSNNQLIDKPEIPNPIYLELAASRFLDDEGEGEVFEPEVYRRLDKAAYQFVLDYDEYASKAGANEERRYVFEVSFPYDPDACASYLEEQAEVEANSQPNAQGPSASDEPFNPSANQAQEPSNGASPPSDNEASSGSNEQEPLDSDVLDNTDAVPPASDVVGPSSEQQGLSKEGEAANDTNVSQ